MTAAERAVPSVAGGREGRLVAARARRGTPRCSGRQCCGNPDPHRKAASGVAPRYSAGREGAAERAAATETSPAVEQW